MTVKLVRLPHWPFFELCHKSARAEETRRALARFEQAERNLNGRRDPLVAIEHNATEIVRMADELLDEEDRQSK